MPRSDEIPFTPSNNSKFKVHPSYVALPANIFPNSRLEDSSALHVRLGIFSIAIPRLAISVLLTPGPTEETRLCVLSVGKGKYPVVGQVNVQLAKLDNMPISPRIPVNLALPDQPHQD